NDETNDSTSTEQMDMEDKLLTNIALVLKGHYPFMRAADRSVEYVFTTGTLFSEGRENTVSFMKNYLRDEIMTIKSYDPQQNYAFYSEKPKGESRERGRQLRIFKDILDDKLKNRIYELTDNENITDKAFDKRLNEIVDSATSQIENFIINQTSEVMNLNPDITSISEDIRKEHGESVINRYVENHILSYFEMTKLFTGDPAYYKSISDSFKRFSMDNSTKKISRIDKPYNAYLNEFYKESPRLDGKIADGAIKSVTVADVEVQTTSMDMLKEIFTQAVGEERAKAYLKPYAEMNEADAQSYATMDEYREILMRAGDWTESQQNAFDKLNRGEQLTANEIAYFPILKIQYSGSLINDQGKLIPAKRKTSVMPLIPQVVKDSNLDKLRQQMIDGQVGITFYESASKVGFRLNNGQKNQIYSTDGQMDISSAQTEELSYEYMGIQLDMAPKVKTQVSQGTQFNILKLSSMFEDGKPKAMHINGESLTEEQVGERVQEVIDLETEMSYYAWLKTLKKMGVNDDMKVAEPYKFLDFIYNEAQEQKVDNNTLESIKTLMQPDGTILEIDMISAVGKIEKLVHTTFNNQIIRKRRHGGARPQVASTGFEVKRENLKSSGQLKFYRWNEDKTQMLPMEVMTSLPKDWMPFVESVGGLDIFNQMLNDDAKLQAAGFDPKALEIVGFRIPTQKMSSADNMKIVKFFPPEAGDIIVMPSEIVAKAGSNFEIDIMNLYLPEVKIGENFIGVVPYLKDTSTNSLKEYYRFHIQQRKSYLKAILKEATEHGLKFALSKYDIDDLAFERLKDEYHLETEEKFIEDNKNKSIYELNSPASVHNRMMELEAAFITSKENAFNLLAPISDSRLKKLAKKIRELKGISSSDPSYSLVSPFINLKKHVNFLLGKGGVGQIAVHITTNVIAQLAGLRLTSIDPYFAPNTSNRNEESVTTGISMGNIVDADGNIISESISEFFNAFVDIVRDPYIFDIGVSNELVNTVLMMVRAGTPLETIVYMVNQPIIHNYMQQRGKITAFRNTRIKREVAVKAIAERYNSSPPPMFGNRPQHGTYLYESRLQHWKKMIDKYNSKRSLYYNMDELIKQIKKPTKDFQIAMLDHWLLYENYASDLQRVLNILNANTKGIGENLPEANFLVTGVQDGINAESFTEESKKKLYDEASYMGTYHRMRLSATSLSNSLQLAPNAEPVSIINMILRKIYQYNHAGFIKASRVVSSEYITYIIQKYLHDKVRKLDKEYNRLFKGNSVAKRILEAKNSKKLSGNRLVKEMFVDLSYVEGGEDKLMLFSNKLDSWTRDELADAFSELKEVDHGLYQDLILYNIIQSGMSNSKFNYLSIIPAADYNALLAQARKYYNQVAPSMMDFIDKFFRENPQYNPSMTFRKDKTLKNVVDTVWGKINGVEQAAPYLRRHVKVRKRSYEIWLYPVLPQEDWYRSKEGKLFARYSLKDYIIISDPRTKVKGYTFQK
ncbi:MAG: hypothetical protein ACOCXH_02155, partial [Cyclobacteriaceae bacterium]